MNSSTLKFILPATLLFFAVPTLALAQPTTIDLVETSLSGATDLIFIDLQSWTIKWLAAFMLIQFIFTNIKLMLEGAELDKVIAKFLGALFWAGLCIYAFANGADFIKSTANFLLQKASGIAGAPFDPSYPVEQGIAMASAMLSALDGTQGTLSILNPFPAIMMGLVTLLILAVCTVISFKVFMIFIETKIVITLTPISFALLGLNAFKDQGLAPFKYLVSLAYRLMIIAAVLATMDKLSNSIVETFNTVASTSTQNVWPGIWAAAIGYALLGGLALRSDSIAAMLASGSSNMSPGDAAAVGAVAGAAAAAATGGLSGALNVAGASKVGASMGDVMKSMMGASSGTVNNASGKGSGGTTTTAEPAPTKPSASLGGGQSKGAPVRPDGPPGIAKAAGDVIKSASTSAGKSINTGSKAMAGIPVVGAAVATTGKVAGAAVEYGGKAVGMAVEQGGKAVSAGASKATSTASSVISSPVRPADSGSGPIASIGAPSPTGLPGGAPGKTESNMASEKPPVRSEGFGDKLKNLNDHVARDTPPVHVSMNTHTD